MQLTSPDFWTAIFTGISTLAVGIGIILAIRELKEMNRTGKLQSSLTFMEKIRSSRDARERIYKELPSAIDEMGKLKKEIRLDAEEVINSLNELAVLVEDNAIDREMFFSICHTMIIRSWYKLEPYALYHESRIGGRYARRVGWLAQRAKLFHDINPIHRTLVIRLDVGKESIPIYQTEVKEGIAGLFQRIVWLIRRRLRIY